jgi:hypothetical protein
MKKILFTTGILAVCLSGFSGCVAEKNTSGASIAPANTQYLNSSELKELYTDKTTLWTSLRNGKSGTSTYNADGTYDRGTWKVTEDGFKCNFQEKRQKEICAKVYKDGEYFIGVKKNGKKIFKFTIK